jgi:hypothetical protein
MSVTEVGATVTMTTTTPCYYDYYHAVIGADAIELVDGFFSCKEVLISYKVLNDYL